MKRIIVGLSGGVDSSVAVLLLKEQGYEVVGLFMRNWHDASVTRHVECPWIEDSTDAMLVAQKLDIPFQVIDLSRQYKERIVDYMFSEYAHGRTPNPDVLCNREIKFNLFLEKARSLGADGIATGHYARRECFLKNGRLTYHLLVGKDINKDQSYFLCQLNQYQLSKSIFPLGTLTKKEVRKIAAEAGLITAEKKDSQGLCFVGKVHLPDFLQQKLQPRRGDIVEIFPEAPIYRYRAPLSSSKKEMLALLSKNRIYKKNDGNIIGMHQGAHYFTKGQRRGLRVGGHKEALFVIETDVKENIVYTGMGKNHPGLYRKALFIREDELHWIYKDLELSEGDEMSVYCRIRYRQPLQLAILYKVENGLYIEFEEFQAAITEGQFAVWYLGEELIGSGIIS
ncbi:MAG: tRNA 2-thiouridine(34) synthase MnmA [Flavobacteriales bacterium AspAUS03]